MAKRRSSYHHGSVREEAIAAAIRELDAHGHDRFTVERVARAIGVTAPALYRHFASRDDLLAAVIYDVFLRFVAEVDAAACADPDPIATLRAVGRAYVRFALRNPGWFRLQFSPTGLAAGVRHEEAQPRYPERLFTALTQLQGDDPKRLETGYLLLWATMHGLAGLVVERVWSHMPDDDARLAVADAVIDALVDRLG